MWIWITVAIVLLLLVVLAAVRQRRHAGDMTLDEIKRRHEGPSAGGGGYYG